MVFSYVVLLLLALVVHVIFVIFNSALPIRRERIILTQEGRLGT